MAESTSSTPVPRRRLLTAGAGVGALAAAAAALPLARPAARQPTPAQAAPPEAGDGYRLSEHVERYYRSARV